MNKSKLLALLKKEAKLNPVTATVKDGEVYLLGTRIGLKMPAAFWPEYLRPFFMRRTPADGEKVCFGGERNSDPHNAVSNLLALETQPLEFTQVIWEVPSGGKHKTVRLYLNGDSPVLVDTELLTMVEVDTPARGSEPTKPVVFGFWSGSVQYIAAPFIDKLNKEAVRALAETLSGLTKNGGGR